VSLIENSDMIKTIPADRPDNAFNEGILPRRSRRRAIKNMIPSAAKSGNILQAIGIKTT